jgi:endonuclease YncB( thermonuclease family)
MTQDSNNLGVAGGPDARRASLARLWGRFRHLPRWVQVAAWVIAWPLVGAVSLVTKPGRLRIATASVLLLVVGPLWATALMDVTGAEQRVAADAASVAGPRQAATDPDPPAGAVGAPEDAPETPAPAEPQPEQDPEPAPEPEPAPDAGPADDGWRVVRIIDGDTVEVRRASSTETVRVIGIDTPERGECGFGDASDALADLVLDREVTLASGARDDRDRYGRILRYLDVGEVDAGLQLIETGLAIARYDSRDGYGRHPREDAYVAADAGTAHVCAGVPEPEPPAPPPAPAGGDGGSGPNGAWKNCTEARENGAAPVHRGDPGYGPHLDRDGDGVGCE